MKKRLFFLVMLAFLLCGCTANVNITIDDNVISEKINISEGLYGEVTINDIAQQYRKYIPAFNNEMIIDTMPDVARDGIEYYKSSGTSVNDVYYANYSYDFKFKEYKNSTSINNAFKSSVVQYDAYEKEILVTTESSGMLLFSSYPQLDEVKVNISTNYYVLENNADYVNGNMYTWIFNKNTKKGVYLLLRDTEGKSISENSKNPENTSGENEENEENEEKESPSNPSSKKEEKGNKTELSKKIDKVQETGKNHPYIVAIIFISLFMFIIIISFKFKK